MVARTGITVVGVGSARCVVIAVGARAGSGARVVVGWSRGTNEEPENAAAAAAEDRSGTKHGEYDRL